ncbi:LOW QUALITY PROTEIN: hypothetical protein PHMEG_00030927 [Phytophthora megakarya]|uniref:Uncharacterized protein n=1 Tax=Phytophthora megakarya TaxID=4795 RepID=A0A225UZ67_9STRA|nr:LOW QUALITY PROTEIN: hypothetical protein PHMEG_00030927 [Phytophthora megakarya]
MACILLGPRTKFSAKKMAAVGNISRKEEKAIYKNGVDFRREQHRQLFMTKLRKIPLSQPSSQNSLLSQDLNSPQSSPSSTGWDDEDELLMRAPIRATKTRCEMKESGINARADCVMREWLELEPEWLEIAQCQSTDKKKEYLSVDMTTDGKDGMHWSLLGLYRHVDVLQLFRDEGDSQFPSIALLAPIHLDKKFRPPSSSMYIQLEASSWGYFGL